ncbi:MAG: hypothetical protein E6J32_03430 [Chloroflexi bacterium]|nr:MAG: hypothetical protein E6J32_03430 [Chloroflexota bacterium]
MRWRLAIGLASLVATIVLTFPSGAVRQVAEIWPNGPEFVIGEIWPNLIQVSDAVSQNLDW